MQVILAAVTAVGAVWLVLGPVQEGFWLAGYRRERLACLRHRRQAFGRVGRLESRTPSGAARRWWNRVRVRAAKGRAVRGTVAGGVAVVK